MSNLEILEYNTHNVKFYIYKILNVVSIAFQQEEEQSEIFEAVTVATLPTNFRPNVMVGTIGSAVNLPSQIELQVLTNGIMRFKRTAGKFSYGCLTYIV